MASKLISASREKFKVNPIAFICLGVLFCVFAALCVALSLLVPFLGAVAVVLLLFPLLCGVVIQSSSLEYFDKVSFKNISAFSARYYSPQFSGSFRLLWCLLRGFIVTVASSFIVTLVVCGIAKGLYPQTFDTCFNALMGYLTNVNSTTEDLNALLTMENGFVGNCLLFIESISVAFGIFVFVISVSFNALGVYFRMLLKPTGLMFGKYSINTAINTNRKALFKDFLLLNWPLIVLLLLGMVGGFLISIFVFQDLVIAVDVGLIFSFVLLMFFAPKYLANMNALFDKYKFLIVIGINDSIKKTIEKIQRTVDLSTEDKERIEEALKECDEEMKQMEEDNKKDSTE